MKKLNWLFIGTCFLLLSCQKRTEMQNLSWKAGDDESSLYKIYDIQTAPQASETIFGDARIEYLQQTLSHQVVENTFVKKVYDSSMQLTSAEAVYIDPRKIFASATLCLTS